jgi:hypothetical protein
MRSHQSMQGQLERALALTHAALADTTVLRVAEAKRYASEVLPAGRMKRRMLELPEAGQLVALVAELCAVLTSHERFR